MREERRAEKEWRWQKVWERKREANRERAIIERKCFVCGGFEHIAYNYRNIENRQKEELIQRFSNKFKVLSSRVVNRGKESGEEIKKDRKTVLREERLKKGKRKIVERSSSEDRTEVRRW